MKVNLLDSNDYEIITAGNDEKIKIWSSSFK
jgi:hypothetical protein